MKIDQVTIIGMGLIGGSLAWSIKDKKLSKVIGCARRQEVIEEAIGKGIIDEGYSDIKDAIKGSKLIFVCTTIDSIAEIVKEITEYVEPGTVIVDVASTKKQIVEEVIDEIPDGVTFIGGHPMAGSEKTGIEAANRYLFDGAKFILTPYKHVDNSMLVKLNHFIERMNMNIVYLSLEQHDVAVAAVSHLPYMLASALINTINDAEDSDNLFRVSANGLRSTTRVASSPTIWGKNIAVTNKDSILSMISSFKDQLTYLEMLIKLGKEDELLAYFEDAVKGREKLS